MAIIIPFPIPHQAAFDDKQITIMAKVLDEVCFKLTILEERAREVVAARILELARRGELNPTKLENRLVLEATAGRGL